MASTVLVVREDGNVFGSDMQDEHHLGPVYQFAGDRIGYNPQDRFMMSMGNTLVVVRQDGGVFGSDVVGRQLGDVYQFDGDRIGYNPQDRFMMSLLDNIIIL